MRQNEKDILTAYIYNNYVLLCYIITSNIDHKLQMWIFTGLLYSSFTSRSLYLDYQKIYSLKQR